MGESALWAFPTCSCLSQTRKDAGVPRSLEVASQHTSLMSPGLWHSAAEGTPLWEWRCPGRAGWFPGGPTAHGSGTHLGSCWWASGKVRECRRETEKGLGEEKRKWPSPPSGYVCLPNRPGCELLTAFQKGRPSSRVCIYQATTPRWPELIDINILQGFGIGARASCSLVSWTWSVRAAVAILRPVRTQ